MSCTQSQTPADGPKDQPTQIREPDAAASLTHDVSDEGPTVTDNTNKGQRPPSQSDEMMTTKNTVGKFNALRDNFLGLDIMNQ